VGYDRAVVIARAVQLTRGLVRYRNPSALPDQLILFVTYVCNLACETCFYWESLNSKRKELTLDQWEKISRSLDEVSQVLISGGEPFLRRDLDDILATFYRNNRTRQIHLPTNALLKDLTVATLKRLLEKCPELQVTLGFSMDGLEETHDRIRGKKGSFKAVVETSRAVAELQRDHPLLRTYVITTVCRQNYDQVEALARFVREHMPVDDFGFSPVRGNPKEPTIEAPTAAQWHDLAARMEPVRRHYAERRFGGGLKTRMLLSRAQYTHDVFEMVLEENRLPYQCKAGQVIGVIEPNGEVRLCELTPIVGDLREHDFDFRKVWFAPAAREMREKIVGCSCSHACFIGASLTQYPGQILKAYAGSVLSTT
jgi:MoaA/NifB/PqqE/SkfB family radical SAM enzyme